jgi:hypothetical protein
VTESGMKYIEERNSYHIVEEDGEYFVTSSPQAYDKNCELVDLDISFRADSISAARSLIDEAVEWANSRGQFSGNRPRAGDQSYLRANSFATASEQIKGKMVGGADILKMNGRNYSVLQTRKPGRSTSKSFRIIVVATLKILKLCASGKLTLSRLKASLSNDEIRELKKLLVSGSGRPITMAGTGKSKNSQMLMYALVGIAKKFIPRISRSHSGFNRKQELLVIGKECTPDLIFAGKNENVVKLDQYFFVIPHGVPVDWEDINAISQFEFSPSLKELYAKLDKKFDDREADTSNYKDELSLLHDPPQVVKEIRDRGYRIVSYEGWFVGLPERLFNVDLREVDIVAEEGVIRDVSMEVVELEILNL